MASTILRRGGPFSFLYVSFLAKSLLVSELFLIFAASSLLKQKPKAEADE
jgi:hypothetical protein